MTTISLGYCGTSSDYYPFLSSIFKLIHTIMSFSPSWSYYWDSPSLPFFGPHGRYRVYVWLVGVLPSHLNVLRLICICKRISMEQSHESNEQAVQVSPQ